MLLLVEYEKLDRDDGRWRLTLNLIRYWCCPQSTYLGVNWYVDFHCFMTPLKIQEGTRGGCLRKSPFSSTTTDVHRQIGLHINVITNITLLHFHVSAYCGIVVTRLTWSLLWSVHTWEFDSWSGCMYLKSTFVASTLLCTIWFMWCIAVFSHSMVHRLSDFASRGLNIMDVRAINCELQPFLHFTVCICRDADPKKTRDSWGTIWPREISSVYPLLSVMIIIGTYSLQWKTGNIASEVPLGQPDVKRDFPFP